VSPDPGDRPLPLAGVVVLDLGRIYQGPWAGFLCAAAGADVIKIESPGGDPIRSRGASGRTTVPFIVMNSCKRSVTLDLKRDEGKALFLRLVERADVVLENFTPGVMERLGLGPDVLFEANPTLVYAAATGYGTSGPDRDLLAMDITVQAHTGVISVTGFPDGEPVKAGAAFIDFLGGTHLYAGIATALFERERTGRGRVVDVAMVDTVYPALASSLISWYRDGTAPRVGNRHSGLGVTPYNVYPAADGHVAIICVAEGHWGRLATAMGRPELGDDERYRTNNERVRRMQEVDDLVGAWTSTCTRAQVASALAEVRVPCAPVRGVGELLEDRHQHERGALTRLQHPDAGEVVVPHSPVRYRGSALRPLEPASALGEHNAEVLGAWLGLPDDELARLAAGGVI
jgi:crotonobetainyl-CoA:carnitine CoA-transferase CaiB-like acyl-CoA transferase